MKTMWMAAAAMLACAGGALAQSEMYAVSFGGDVFRVNTSTGAATLLGPTGFGRLNGMAADASGRIYAYSNGSGANPPVADRIIRINRSNGDGTLQTTLPLDTDLRGLAFVGTDTLNVYAIRDGGSAVANDQLVRINIASGVVTVIGTMGRPDFQGLEWAPFGELYAVAVDGGNGSLHRVSISTGVTTPVGGQNLGDDAQAIEVDEDGVAFTARASLRRVNLASGVDTVVGPTGQADLRGLAAAEPCYANCDGSSSVPVLTPADFVCFLNRFRSGCPN